jgi:hypothetical protein
VPSGGGAGSGRSGRTPATGAVGAAQREIHRKCRRVEHIGCSIAFARLGPNHWAYSQPAISLAGTAAPVLRKFGGRPEAFRLGSGCACDR